MSFYLINSLYKSKIFTLTFQNILLISLISSSITQPVTKQLYFLTPMKNNLNNILKDNYEIH
jgi:hypothetical protein